MQSDERECNFGRAHTGYKRSRPALHYPHIKKATNYLNHINERDMKNECKGRTYGFDFKNRVK